MKDWFSSFEECLDGGNAPADLIGAGTATSERAMAHYRFQHEAKFREAVEDTFPVLRRYLGEEWNGIWEKFRAQNEVSPRNLDEAAGVFLSYFVTTTADLWKKELARFEHRMDIHPWNHRSNPLKEDLALAEDCRVILGTHEVIPFSAPVTLFYEETDVKEPSEKQTVLIWQKGESVYYRPLEEWELEVLGKLSEGVEAALEFAPEDPEAVGEFFRWLGSSHLIQEIKPD